MLIKLSLEEKLPKNNVLYEAIIIDVTMRNRPQGVNYVLRVKKRKIKSTSVIGVTEMLVVLPLANYM